MNGFKLQVDKEAIRQLEKAIEGRRASLGADADTRLMLAQDRKNWRRVITLYKAGRWVEAHEIAMSMDSEPRDYIPEAMWKHFEIALDQSFD